MPFAFRKQPEIKRAQMAGTWSECLISRWGFSLHNVVQKEVVEDELSGVYSSQKEAMWTAWVIKLRDSKPQDKKPCAAEGA